MISENHNYDYDVVVIGAGPGGAEAAQELGKHNKKVALIEGEAIGGTCLNRGCIPAKTMLYMAEMYRQVKKMADYGIYIEENAVKVDYPGMLERRDQIMDRLRKGLGFMLKKNNVELIEAYAEMIDAHTISLSTGNQITAENVILATGGQARKFPGFIEEDARFLISDDIFKLTSIPKSITIVGAGPVGTEFASYYHSFGAEVHIVEMSETFFPYFDHKLGAALIKEFKREGIQVHTETVIESVDTSGEGLVITLQNGEIINSQYVLSAIGVEVNGDYLKALEIERDPKSGRVAVDNKFKSSIPNIFALGDLIGKSGSAYGAEREGKHIAYALMGLDANLAPINYTAMPDVVFTHPEVATCGFSQQELDAANKDYITKSVQFLVNGKANVKNERRGTIWMYVEANTNKILGVHIIGPQATELIHMVPILLLKEITTDEYLKTVWGHPVLSELLREVMVLG